MSAPIVIVGSGFAGYALLRALRRVDREIPVVVVTADDGPAYPKFGLVDAVARGIEARDLVLATAEQMAFRYDATVLTGRKATAIDRARREILTVEGSVHYGRAVLATGVAARRPAGLHGSAASQVLTLRDLADYAYLRRRLAGCRDVLVVGGSVAGCELADGLARAGFAVRLFEVANRLFGSALPGLFSQRVEQALQRAGVTVMIEDGLQCLEQGRGSLEATSLAGRRIEADVVVAALGSRPRAELARRSGLRVANGVVVDDGFATDDPQVFAFGECAELEPCDFSSAEDFDAGAGVLAAILAGANARMRRRPVLRAVRLSRCPAAVCVPPPLAGEWYERSTPRGVRSLFLDRHGTLRGFALAGDAVADGAALFARIAR